MHKIARTLRIGLLYALAVFMVGGVPLTALAETVPPTTTESSATESAPVTTPSTTPSTTEPSNPATSTTVPVTATAPASTITPPPAEATSPVTVAPLPVSANTAAPAVTITPASQPEASPTPTAARTTTTSGSATPTTSVNTSSGVTNTITSDAQSGSAQTTKNTTAGDTATGNATGQTTVVNTVHSTVQGDTTGVAHFTADINGNVTGDITLAPNINGALSQSGIADPASKLQVNNSTDLANNINVNATSGNADVSKNTTAGDVTTGNANAVANVVNLINSIIAANQSFVGTINIYGNLNGDILVSPNFIPQLLASNADNSSLNSALGPLTSDLSSANNQSIINNINLQATSGTAQATGNTTVGNVGTGNAQTNLTVLNLTGEKVVAKNSLLVFVNVLGKWVGMIVDAPGATAAALGNGVTSNTISPFDQSLSAQNNGQITNNINLAAQSGNANAFANTTVGNIATGNATASANIANIDTSSFSLSDWFGVLFINVFGSWYGSFGINTASGEVVPINSGVVPVNPGKGSVPAVQFGFTPRTFATLHKDTLPFRMPASTGALNVTTGNPSQGDPVIITAASTNDPSNGSGDQVVDEQMIPNPITAVHEISPFALALMATGFVGMTAPVLASLGRHRRSSVRFNK